MGTDAADVLSLQCPECRALLRMRAADAGEDLFPCPDCGRALRVARLDDGTDSGLLLLEVAVEQEAGGKAVAPRTAKPGRQRRKPKPRARRDDSELAATDEAATTAAAGGTRFALLEQAGAWAGRLKRPTPAQLTWTVAGVLAIGLLLLLYVPAEEEAGPAESAAVNSADVTAQLEADDRPAPELKPAGNGRGTVGVAGHLPGGGQPDPAERRDAGDPQLAATPPDEVVNVPQEGGLPAGDEPAAEVAKPEAEVDAANEPPSEEPPAVAARPPVVAPRPEVPDVPPIDLQVALAIRLQSYRMTEPAPAGVLLRELEEMTGVEFREVRREGQADDWKQRPVLISMEDVTVGELLERVTKLAGAKARIDGNTVQLIPPVSGGGADTEGTTGTSPARE